MGSSVESALARAKAAAADKMGVHRKTAKERVEAGAKKAAEIGDARHKSVTETRSQQKALDAALKDKDELIQAIAGAPQNPEIMGNPEALEVFTQALQKELDEVENRIVELEGQINAALPEQKAKQSQIEQTRREARAILQGREMTAEEFAPIWQYVEDGRKVKAAATVFAERGRKLAEGILSQPSDASRVEFVIDLNAELEQKIKERDAGALDFEGQRATLRQLLEAKNQAEQNFTNAKNAIYKTNGEYKPHQESEARKERDIAALQTALNKSREELVQLQERLQIGQVGRSKEEGLYNTWLKEEYQPAVDRLAELQKAWEAHQTRLAAEQTKLDGLKSQLTAADGQHKDLHQQLVKARAKVSRAEQNQRDNERELATQRKALTDLREWEKETGTPKIIGKIQKVQADYDKAAAELPGLRETLVKLEIGTQKALDAKEALDLEVKTQAGIVEQLGYGGPERDINSLKQKLGLGRKDEYSDSGLEQRKNAMLKDLTGAQNRLEALQRQIDDKNAEIITQNGKLERNQQELAQITEKAAPLKQAWEAAGAASDQAESAQTLARNQYREFDQQVDGLDEAQRQRIRAVALAEQALRDYQTKIQNPQIYNGLVRGFAQEYGRALGAKSEGAHPARVVLKAGEVEAVLWDKNQASEPRTAPEMPAELRQLGKNSAVFIQQAIDNPDVQFGQLQGNIAKAEVVSGLYEEIAAEAEGEYKINQAAKIEAKQKEIQEIQSLRKSVIQTAGQYEKQEKDVKELIEAVQAWQEASSEYERDLAEAARLQKDLDYKKETRKGYGFWGFRQNKLDLDQSINKLEKTDLPAAISKAEGTKHKMDELEKKVLGIRPGAIETYDEKISGGGRVVSKKRLVKNISMLSQERAELVKRAESEKGRASVLERVAEAWQAGKMLNYSGNEAAFVLSDIKMKGKEQQNTLDSMADEVAYALGRITEAKPIVLKVRVAEDGVDLFTPSHKRLSKKDDWVAFKNLNSTLLLQELERKIFNRLNVARPDSGISVKLEFADT